MSDADRHVTEQTPISALEAGVCTYLASTGMDWCPAKPGIAVKTLYTSPDGNQRTVLFKLEAGARSAPHSHTSLEQIYVLEGAFFDGQRWLRAGDHCVRPPGVVHSAYSEQGAVALVVYSPAAESAHGA